VDLETLFILYQKDPLALEDSETKQIYHYLFRLLRKSVASCSNPAPDLITLGEPPYDKPFISRALMALLALRYGYLSLHEWVAVVDLGKIILFLINNAKLDPPTTASQRLAPGLYEKYKSMYTRFVDLIWILINSRSEVLLSSIFTLQCISQFQVVDSVSRSILLWLTSKAWAKQYIWSFLFEGNIPMGQDKPDS